MADAIDNARANVIDAARKLAATRSDDWYTIVEESAMDDLEEALEVLDRVSARA